MEAARIGSIFLKFSSEVTLCFNIISLYFVSNWTKRVEKVTYASATSDIA